MPLTAEQLAEIDRIRREALKWAEEQEARRTLALQMIDAGYKALASKLHPDKGGSPEAVMRLNQVRDLVKAPFRPSSKKRKRSNDRRARNPPIQ